MSNANVSDAPVPQRLLKRADFLRAAKGARFHTSGFSLQANLAEPSQEAPRVGLTVTRKEGGAVERNRMRRRLRAAIRTAVQLPLRPDHDYVIVARHALLAQSFPVLCAELRRALTAIHTTRAARRPAKTKPQSDAGPHSP